MPPLRDPLFATALLIALSCGGSAAAQASIGLPPGMIIEETPTQYYKVVECGLDHAFLGYKECSVEVYFHGALLGGGLRRFPEEQLLKILNDDRTSKNLPPLTRDPATGKAVERPKTTAPARAAATASATTARPRLAATQELRTNPTPSPAATAGRCPQTPNLDVPGSQAATPANLKQALANGHTFKQSSYLWTGVTFESFDVGQPVRNKITMRPGVGPERVTDAAPPDTLLYPVKSSYIVCHQYGSGPERIRIRSGNWCFVSRSGKWACGRDSSVAPVTTTNLP